MTGFALIATTMVGVAMLFLLPPLLRSQPNARDERPGRSNLLAYRQQLTELEADVRSGLLSADQHEDSRLELERRVLEELPSTRAAATIANGSARRSAVAVGLFVPLVAALLYWHLGSPVAMEFGGMVAPDPHAAAHEGGADQLEVVTERLARRLGDEPGDAAGWALLARSYSALGRRQEALAAFDHAAKLAPTDGQLLADFADAAAMEQGGRLAGAPMELVHRALAADPDNVKALALAGTEAFERHDYPTAIRHWERGLTAAGPGSEFGAMLEANLAEARALARGPAARLSAPAAKSVSGRVVLASRLAGTVAPDDTLLLFARAPEGPRMPLALIKAKVKDLPLDFTLDDSAAMVPAMTLSSAARVTVVARVSKSGAAQAQPGDLQGVTGPVSVGVTGLRVEIDEMVR